MRPLKFRAWDKKRKEWYGASNPNILTFYDFHIFGECTLLCTPRCKDLQHLEITQFTGLKDKNGKAIYEGDVIKCIRNCLTHEGEVVYTVKFEEGTFCVDTHSFLWNLCDSFEPEIIGNIFESPELINKEACKRL